MAKRIPVILSQTAFANVQRRHLEEELVTRLLLEDGVEISVIPHLEHLEAEDTGLLCLEGIGGDMILLCWTEPQQAISVLRGKGVDGRLGATTMSSAADRIAAGSRTSGRTIYAIDLREHSSPEPFRREIQRIVQESQTVTFQIAMPTPQMASSASPPRHAVDPTLAASQDHVAGQGGGGDPDDRAAPSESARPAAPPRTLPILNWPAAPSPLDRDSAQDDSLDLELDQLLDEFEASDL